MSNIDQLKQIIHENQNIVFFGGAGVSTESGIPDFRSVDGLYNQSYDYPPETILSHTFYMKQPEIFFRFYREKILSIKAQPNAAHLKLAQWEQSGKLNAVVTQNIDGLHQAAGSKNVIELHGSAQRNYCENCHAFHSAADILPLALVPLCQCGGRIKPDVVLYEESLDHDILTSAVNHIASADVLIIGGTSLVVYPAAGLVDYFRGDHLIVVNKSPTPRDAHADLLIQENIGAVFAGL